MGKSPGLPHTANVDTLPPMGSGRSMECLPVPSDPCARGSPLVVPRLRDVARPCCSLGTAEREMKPPQVSWGVFEHSWVMTVPGHAQAQWWAKDMWNPATTFWHRGVLMMRPTTVPLSRMGPVSTRNCPFLKCGTRLRRPHWNEVLLEPHEGHSFLAPDDPHAMALEFPPQSQPRRLCPCQRRRLALGPILSQLGGTPTSLPFTVNGF